MKMVFWMSSLLVRLAWQRSAAVTFCLVENLESSPGSSPYTSLLPSAKLKATTSGEDEGFLADLARDFFFLLDLGVPGPPAEAMLNVSFV